MDPDSPPNIIVHDYGTLPRIAHEAGRPKLPPLGEILKTIPLEEFLQKDKTDAEQNEQKVRWFHGKINRETAVRVLRENGNRQGLFLVRESGADAPGEFVVSVLHAGQPYHFQIHSHGDMYYQLVEGPLFHGLVALIDFYMDGAHGLKSKLGAFCKGEAPPAKTRKSGWTTPLHRAVLEGDLDIVHRILKSSLCSPLDARDADGRTALHCAAWQGLAEIAEALIDAGACVDCKDGDSVTSLYSACLHNQPRVCKLLLYRGADPTIRQPTTAFVPLHEAAKSGHTECVQELLKAGAPCHPRSLDNDTPLDLARRFNRQKTIKALESYRPPCPPTIRSYWDHGSLSHSMAMDVIDKQGAQDGQFLVRSFFSLTMAANGNIYNFDINQRNGRFFIDDGPYFDSIEHLVDYYMRYDDGFHVRLTLPISPNTCTPNHYEAPSQYLPMAPVKMEEHPPVPTRPLPGSLPACQEGSRPSSPPPPPTKQSTSRRLSYVTVRYLNVDEEVPCPASPSTPSLPKDVQAESPAPTSECHELHEEFSPIRRIRRCGRLFAVTKDGEKRRALLAAALCAEQETGPAP
ncbi:tyrosine-protein kinase HTK16-like [Patiria miniata]|uniref:SH2 domain-containing protein n=1 Tax=Patiria miniata TaxID=46514 RepID=A0A913ZGJ0_PATMI|nr:tyrosine-protein kinase HTK16-like [Patiria miniata]